jgi:hypothetical protein
MGNTSTKTIPAQPEVGDGAPKESETTSNTNNVAVVPSTTVTPATGKCSFDTFIKF